MGEGKKHLFEKVEKMHADVAEAPPIERRLVGGGAKGGTRCPPLPQSTQPTPTLQRQKPPTRHVSPF